MKTLIYCFVNVVCLVLISNKTYARECAEATCKDPIAKAVTQSTYGPAYGKRVAFKTHENVVVLARDVGPDKLILIRKSDGSEGYASHQYIRETKVLVKKQALITLEDPIEVIKSSPVKEEVYDGTTFHNTYPEENKVDVEPDVPKPVTETPELIISPKGVFDSPPKKEEPLLDEKNAIISEEDEEGGEEDEEEIEDDSEGEDEGEEVDDDESTEKIPSSNLKASPLEMQDELKKLDKENAPEPSSVKTPETETEDLAKEITAHAQDSSQSTTETQFVPAETAAVPINQNETIPVTEPAKIAEIVDGSTEKLPTSNLKASLLEMQDELKKLEKEPSSVKTPETEIKPKEVTNKELKLNENLTNSLIEDSATEITAQDSATKAVESLNVEKAVETPNESKLEEGKVEEKVEILSTEPIVIKNITSDLVGQGENHIVPELTTPKSILIETEPPKMMASEATIEQTTQIPVVAETKHEESTTGTPFIPEEATTIPTSQEESQTQVPDTKQEDSTTETQFVPAETTAIPINQEEMTTPIPATEIPETLPVTEPTIIAETVDNTGEENNETFDELYVYEPPVETAPRPKIVNPIHMFGHGSVVSILNKNHHHNHQHQHHNHDHHHHEEPVEENKVESDLGAVLGSHSGHVDGDHLLSTDSHNLDPNNCDQNSCPKATNQQQQNGFQHPLVTNKLHQHSTQLEEDTEVKMETENSENFNFSSESVETDYVELIMIKILEVSDLIIYLFMTSLTLIIFTLGHYCINRNRREKPLIYKLNLIERDLMACHKENGMLRSDLFDKTNKLVSIENNSFGSNDMVLALKKELEIQRDYNEDLQEEKAALERELETAAEAGLELNKMVAELLNQSGSDSIALTVDELQRQLNEQQETIMSMNMTLAAKSRENTDLQILISNQADKFKSEFDELEQAFNDLKLEKSNIMVELEHLKGDQDGRISVIARQHAAEASRLNNEIKAYQSKFDESKRSLETSTARVEALEECIKDIKKGASNGMVEGLIDSAELKADLLVLNKEKSNLQDRLQGEVIARQLLDDHVKMINEEISNLKKEFSRAEKEKLEAETRLEVLSTYFKDKETQLQKELSIKEAMWMQSQGETTSTVERIRSMQDEIQTLKSQNDALRAEIEAQATAHKAQNAALEARAHEAWLSARQAERKYDESRSESSMLRRKLTTLGDVSAVGIGNVMDPLPNELNLNAPSPIRVESPNNNMMNIIPPPFMPPPFMGGPPPPFMPPHFMPPGEMRPPPLGRLMSPPPPNRYSPGPIDDRDRDRDRYSPERGRYSPDSRYDYSVMSNYETETDFSPPPSPPGRHYNRDRDLDHRDRDHRDERASGNGGYNKPYSPPPPPPHSHRTSPPVQDSRNKKYKGGFSSGSQDSITPRKGGKYSKLST